MWRTTRCCAGRDHGEAGLGGEEGEGLSGAEEALAGPEGGVRGALLCEDLLALDVGCQVFEAAVIHGSWCPSYCASETAPLSYSS